MSPGSLAPPGSARPRAGALTAVALLLALIGSPTLASEYAEARAALVAEIARDARETASFTGDRRFDDAVLEAIGTVPRHRFVPDDLQRLAYANRPLPIGHGQTISQPYIVALMTHLVDPQPDDVVLEIGTGSGYQAAVLAELAGRVYSIEIIPALGESASRRLRALGYGNVETRIGDGYHGWPEHGPYDAIVVTAAASHIPPPLVAQLADGGVMVIPVGSQFQVQQLTVVAKDSAGGVTTRQLLPVRFVPLTGEH